MAEMMEQYGEMSHAPTYARRIVTMEHLIKLFFELATDTAFIPGQTAHQCQRSLCLKLHSG